jgi:hypothetical protein
MEMLDQLIEMIPLVKPDPEEMEAAVADLVHSWKRFRQMENLRPEMMLDTGSAGLNWWKALDQLALADSRCKEAFICGDRSPASIQQYAKFRRKVITGEKYRTDA